MDRPNQPDAPGGLFVDDGTNGQVGTVLRADFMNALTDEAIHLIEGAGLNPSGTNTSQLLQAVQILGGGGSGGTGNVIINGDMAIWQRGTSFDVDATGAFTADRWRVVGDSPGGAGLGTVTLERKATQPGVIDGFWDFLRYTPTVPATGEGPRIRQHMDVFAFLSEQRCTLSFLVRASSTIDLVVELQTGLGALGNIFSVVSSTTVQAGAIWSRQVISFDMPDISGGWSPTGPGPGGNGTGQHLQVAFQLPTGDSAAVDIAQVQLEASGAPSEFRPRDPSVELMLCRRFFQTSFPYGVAIGSNSVAGRIAVFASRTEFRAFQSVRFVPEMRAAPSVKFFFAGQAGRVSWDGVVETVNGSEQFTRDSASIVAPTVAGGAPSNLSMCEFHYTASAEL